MNKKYEFVASSHSIRREVLCGEPGLRGRVSRSLAFSIAVLCFKQPEKMAEEGLHVEPCDPLGTERARRGQAEARKNHRFRCRSSTPGTIRK